MTVLDDRLREHFEMTRAMPAPPLDLNAPMQRARRRRRNRIVAVAVSAVLAVAGIAGVISSLAGDNDGATRTVDQPDVPEDEPQDAAPEPPAASADSAPTSDSGLISPDRWTFAVVIGDASSDGVAQVVDEVREWEGVTDIVQVPATSEAWEAVTGPANAAVWGRVDICRPDSICGEGFVILVADDESVGRIARQLQQRNQFLDVVISDASYQRLADEYVDAMSELQGPPEPTFDTAPFGIEQILVDRRTVEEIDGVPVIGDIDGEPAVDGMSSIDGVGIENDGWMWLGVARLEAAGATAAWSLMVHPDDPNAAPLPSLQIGTSGSGSYGFDFPGSPPYFIIALRDGDRSSVAAVGGLPPHSSVVTTTLSDGTRIWQRPVSGLVIFDTFPDIAPTFTVLDADGLEILSVVVGVDNLYQITEPGEVAD